MARILCFDTSTKACSISVQDENGLKASVHQSESRYIHSEKLNDLIDQCIQKAGINYEDLDAIAVGKGPGSYTGLRIGVSTAKGLAYALDIPLIGIGTLELMAAHVVQDITVPIRLCPMLDARRMEVYSCLFDFDLKALSPTSAMIIDKEAFHEEFESGPILFFGDGMPKCKEILSRHPNAKFLEDVEPHAEAMAKLALARFENSSFEDTAYFEPFYLKEFLAGTPKKLV